MKRINLFLFFLLFLIPINGENATAQQNYTGSYQVKSGDVILTLTIQQDGFNGLTGSLVSNNGKTFIAFEPAILTVGGNHKATQRTIAVGTF